MCKAGVSPNPSTSRAGGWAARHIALQPGGAAPSVILSEAKYFAAGHGAHRRAAAGPAA
jgi:hypothetical protein